ncbi:MAG: isoprenylcysteine carboxylmethyltransferase family protein [Clostridiales Family XIII bacterium]|uniref:methyltransferase family protein n=1 Tax=Hominibacterium faecale TaxID=2839743 RepID=UPI0022B298BF|nr:isoprenylcysteine carboxylmethyltransferase family protein [Hominibacterium faecale]MCI7300364.1 isoprenylcysteine carboxylmethyltransferase family protein [Clostridia bacterium]MDY3011537.1 isoprenylcysteine carboxylmethyltransferase family protein [Clostridiales Family XIII bacterium]
MMEQLLAVFALLSFYGVYFGKLFAQKKQGIKTNQIAKGKKEKKQYRIERIMGIATYGILFVQLLSIAFDYSWLPRNARFTGFLLAMLGVLLFAVSVWSMKDSWRAGIPEKDKTELITEGVYQYSRNPAFLGFDFMYTGILLMFFNPVLLVFTIFAAIMLHLQILQEERFLEGAFGIPYMEYKQKVFRYLGRR